MGWEERVAGDESREGGEAGGERADAGLQGFDHGRAFRGGNACGPRLPAWAAIAKAARKLVPLIDFYPLEKWIDHLTTFVVEIKDAGVPLAEVHDGLRARVLDFLHSFAAQGEWEVVYAVKGIDRSGVPFTVAGCVFSQMNDDLFILWGRRFSTGLYRPPEDGPVYQAWFQDEEAIRGQLVATTRVRATDLDHARAKGRSRVEEVIHLLRFGQLVVGFPEQPFPEVGLWERQWRHDHSIAMRLDKPGFGTHQTLGGPEGNSYSMSRRAPGWEGLERLVQLDLSARSEMQLRLTTALQWIGQAALAPSTPTRLVALVTALEALLIEESESLGKKTKLSSRASKLVGQSEAERRVLVGEIEDIYEARSECVHAGLLDVEKREIAKAARLLAKTIESLHRHAI